MDLRNFTNTAKPKNKNKNREDKTSNTEIIFSNNSVQIKKIDDKIEFTFKNNECMKKYEKFMFFSNTTKKIANSQTEIEDFFHQSMKDEMEGIMIKSLNSTYKPGLRTKSMVKLKQFKDPLDVVIIGAEHGKGKRAGFYSSFLVALRNENFTDDDEFLQIGKVGSGLKESGKESCSIEKLSNMLKPYKIKQVKGITYFTPKIILEIEYQEIQKSKSYNSGFALRFPRVLRIREDKKVDEINSILDLKD